MIPVWMRLGLSGVGLFLSSWIVIPAPIFALLPLAVGAPEISPLLLTGNAIVLGISLLQGPRSLLGYLAITLSTCALVLSSLPLWQVPATVQQANSRMQAALGADYLTHIAPDQVQQMRSDPMVLMDVIRGLPQPQVRHDRQSFLAADGTTLELEIYRPMTSGVHPTIVTLYGGAWKSGEPTHNAAFNTYMANQGYTVVAIDYRHAPRHRFPHQVEDVQTALAWVRQQAGKYGIDTDRIALLGWSAGAHLALLAAYQPEVLPIRAVVGYYGPTNLTAGYYDPPVPDPIDTRAILEAFLGGSPRELPRQYELASPINYVKPGLPPTLLIYGSRDHVVKPIYGQQLYDQLQMAGNQAVLISLPWAEHSFDAVFRGLGNQVALYYTERFLGWALR